MLNQVTAVAQLPEDDRLCVVDCPKLLRFFGYPLILLVSLRVVVD